MEGRILPGDYGVGRPVVLRKRLCGGVRSACQMDTRRLTNRQIAASLFGAVCVAAGIVLCTVRGSDHLEFACTLAGVFLICVGIVSIS